MFVAFTAVLSDALAIITDSSKKFLTESMDVNAANAHVSVAMAAIQEMKDEPGTCVSEFLQSLIMRDVCNADGIKTVSTYYKDVQLQCSEDSKNEFLSLKNCFSDSLIEGLEDRPCNEGSVVLTALSLLEPQIARFATTDERDRLIALLHSHFKSSNVSSSRPKKELTRLTPLLSGCYAGLRFDALARVLLIRHKDNFPEACKLAEIVLALLVSTASCERGSIYRIESK
jgi:hypothetical protein